MPQLWAEYNLIAVLRLAVLRAHQPRCGEARQLHVLQACPALRAKAQGRLVLSSFFSLRATSPNLISCSRSNLFPRQLTVEMRFPCGETLRSVVLPAGTSRIMTQLALAKYPCSQPPVTLCVGGASPVQSCWIASSSAFPPARGEGHCSPCATALTLPRWDTALNSAWN